MASPKVAIVLSSLVACLFVLDKAQASSVLQSGEYLNAGQSLTTGPYTFVMQGDCNLVLYINGNHPLWASNTVGRGGVNPCVLAMQNDGNLVIYSGTDPVWASNTSGAFASYYLNMQGDGNVVIYGPNGAIWATNTVQN